jgi:glycosyltransferase involved in cell wall biosynthesis
MMIRSGRRRRAGRPGEPRRPRVLIIVQNLPVPLDRRVWQESRSLVAAGFGVSVVCPAGPDDRRFEVLEGVEIHRYRPPAPRQGVAGYLVEFAYCWLASARLAVRCFRRQRFDVIQACNPPDTFWALALLFRPLGVRFVYDQHDLCPEVFAARFGTGRRPLHQALRLLERASYASADAVISTNDSYRRVALERGRLDPASVTVVRSGPHPDEMHRIEPREELRGDARHLLVWLGIMGPQDGVDLLLRAIHVLVHDLERKDVQLAVLGFGDCDEDLRALCTNLGLDAWVHFTGRADRTMIAEYLSTADVGLCPDPKNAFTDASTMNKVLEYMAHELPIVSFDLAESRVSAGPAARFVESGDVADFARAVADLLDDPDRRLEMGQAGRRRVEAELGWPAQAERYVALYERVCSGSEDERRMEVSA